MCLFDGEMVTKKRSRNPPYIPDREDYFTAWLESESTQAERDKVVDRQTAKEFIKNVFTADSSLSNLYNEYLDKAKGQKELDMLLDSNFIQGLIKENTDGIPKKLVEGGVPRVLKSDVKLTRRTSLSRLVPADERMLRRDVLNAVYNRPFQSRALVRLSMDRRGRLNVRDSGTGRFISYGTALRRADPLVKADPRKRGEIERLLRLRRIQD